jgi:hypothetical protein
MEDHDHVAPKIDSEECVKRTRIQFAREIEQSMESAIANGFDQMCKIMTELPESLPTLSGKHQSDQDNLQRQIDELRAMQWSTATEQREGRIRLQDIDRALQQRIEQAQRQVSATATSPTAAAETEPRLAQEARFLEKLLYRASEADQATRVDLEARLLAKLLSPAKEDDSDKPKKNLLRLNIYTRELVTNECLVVANTKFMEDVAPNMDFKLSGPDLDSHFTVEFPDSRVGDAMRYTFCSGSCKYKHVLG